MHTVIYVGLQKNQQEILEKFRNKSLQVKTFGQLNLDSRIIKIERNKNSKNFDYWIICKFPRKNRVRIPFRETRHMKKLVERGFVLKDNTLRIKKNGEVELVFVKEQPKSSGSQEIGIDTGRNKAFITSDDVKDNTSKDLLNNLRNKKHGSNNKKGQVARLKQIYDKEIKKIDFKNLKTIFLEKLTGMKIDRKWGNTNHHWSYSHIQNRIRFHATESDFTQKNMASMFAL